MGRGPSKQYYKVLDEDYVKGTLTCLKPEIIRQEINTDFPLVVNIEPTNICDLKCIYCPRTKAQKGVGMMPWELYRKIIDELAEHRTLKMLHLFKDGESFLHPDFIKMVHYAKAVSVAKTVRINSNAVCWDDNKINEILDSGIDDITISVDAAYSITYSRDKKKDCLKRVESNIKQLLKKRNDNNKLTPFIRVKAMEFNGISKEEIEAFIKKWEGIADEVQITGIHDWGGAVNGIEITDEKTDYRYPCAIMWYALAINWDGKVTVCSVDWDTEIEVGDVVRESLHDIWNGIRLKDARKSQIDRNFSKFSICRNCVVWVSVGDMHGWLEKHTEFYK